MQYIIPSGATDGGQMGDSPPSKLNAKTWPPINLYLGFSTPLIVGSCFFAVFGVFPGDIGF